MSTANDQQRPNLQAIRLDNVRWDDETWDYGNTRALSVAVYDGETRVLSSTRSWRTTKQVTPPKYETREVVFEVRDRPDDPDCPVRYVTQEVEVVIDPGVTRELTPDEMRDQWLCARESLIEFLRHVAWAGHLLGNGGA